MPEPMTLEEQAEEALKIYNASFDRLLSSTVASLHRHADQIERFRVAYNKDPSIDDHGDHKAVITARRVLGDILWMVPNLGLDGLAELAEAISINHRQMKRLRARRTLGLPTHPPETEE